MNYRHAFHAGNFADLLKHAALTLCLEALSRRSGALTVIDTHAGAGVYDLGAVEARKSGEATLGIARLAGDPAAPEAFDALLATVARINDAPGTVRFYPGSPMLIASALRDGDRLFACELRAEEHALLAELLGSVPGACALHTDGFDAVADRSSGDGSSLVIIDPPYERGDDYARVVSACAAIFAQTPTALVIVWLPLKDLETFDRFLRGLEEIEPAEALIVECRLRPLDNPMAMNGCALVILNPPAGIAAPIEQANQWIVGHCGGSDASSRVWSL